MAKGISLHIGLNYVNPEYYDGFNKKLKACESDAIDFKFISESCGYSSKIMLREDATRENVINFIKNTALRLKSGDIFLLTYSGHGSQVMEVGGNNDEDDGLDETWCLFNGELIDDELRYLWTLFDEGVRVLVISDSCTNGTIIGYRDLSPLMNQEGVRALSKAIPERMILRLHYAKQNFYNEIFEEMKQYRDREIKASIKLISASQDSENAYDGYDVDDNSFFMTALKSVWDRGSFLGSYRKFKKEILKKTAPYQTPNLLNRGKKDQNFDRQNPFQI